MGKTRTLYDLLTARRDELPKVLFDRLATRGWLNWMPDVPYLKLKYRLWLGKPLQLKNPECLTAKLQWLKLNARRPLYTQMADKYRVRKYVADAIGDEYLVPLIGMWENVDDIDFDSLPNQFVLKCNHDRGSAVICRDKAELDIEQAKSKLKSHLRRNHYYLCREWQYKDIRRCVIAEQYLEDETGGLIDYKLECFDGKPRMTLVCCDRFSKYGTQIGFYDNNWELTNLSVGNYPSIKTPVKRPSQFEKMKQLAALLSKDAHFLRVDLYEVHGRIYFGELTFFPSGGFSKYLPEPSDSMLGSWVTLPQKD